MSHIALYQKYRSQTFDEVVGQEYVVQSVKNAIKEKRIGHAYLFCGPRGTGKTTMARLLARAITCNNPDQAPCGVCESCIAAQEGTHPDIIEINAANETHVEDIRDLIERSRLAPMISGRKVYIIDEVHQLSSSAASALLKTLEEPPEQVVFILATTDPQKLINTIISRCQRFDFTKVDAVRIKDHLMMIAEKEGFSLDASAAMKIAKLADGGMRDALSVLEQVSSYARGNITEEQIDHVYGLSSTEQKLNLLGFVFQSDIPAFLTAAEQYESAGMDFKKLTSELIDCLKDAAVWQCTKQKALLRCLREEEAQRLSDYASAARLLEMSGKLIETMETYRYTQSVTTVLEIACLEMMVSSEAPVLQMERTKPIRTDSQPKQQPKEVEPENKNDKKYENVVIQAPEAPALQVHVKSYGVPEVLSILAQCDKPHKAEDRAKLDQCLRGPMDQYAAVLRDVELKASGEDCLLLSGFEPIVNRINEEEFNKGLYLWLKEHGIDRMPFAITDQVYELAENEFRELWREQRLPEPMKIERYVTEEPEQEKQPLDLALDLFGEELVEIEEDQ